MPGIDNALAQSLGYINSGTGAASNYLTQGYGGAQGAVNTGADAARGILDSGTLGALGFVGGGANQAQRYLGQGVAGAMGQYGQARADLQGGAAAYEPLSSLASSYGQGRALYQDALGINGPGGNARATSAFEAGPGYNFQLDQGLDAINRRRNAGGMLASGNADRDAQVYGQGLAKQEYNNWLNNLGGFVSPELQATSGAAAGQAGIASNLASLGQGAAGLLNSAGAQRAGVATNAGNTLADVLRGGSAASAGLESGRGTTLADLLTREGTAQAGLYGGQGQTLANLIQSAEGQRLGLTQNVMAPYANTYNQEANAQMQGSQNLWGLGLGLANIGGGLLGKMYGSQPVYNFGTKG